MTTRLLSSALAVSLAAIAWPATAAAQRFQVAGVDSDSAVFHFLTTLQTAVTHDDSTAVAALVAYPLSVNRPHGGFAVGNRRTFLLRYRQIITPPVRRAILAQVPDSLFANWQGLMIGRGDVWFGPECGASAPKTCATLHIIAINLDAPEDP